MSGPLRVLLAHADDADRTALTTALVDLDHEVVEVCSSAQDLVRLAVAHRPDLIVASLQLPDRDSIAALVEISEHVAIPTVLIAQKSDVGVVEQASLDHVMAFLTAPVRIEEIIPTIHLVLRRFEQFEEMRAEIGTLKQTLADRTVIERAKSHLMRRADVGEEEAYRQLRRLATDRRAKLVDVARRELRQN